MERYVFKFSSSLEESEICANEKLQLKKVLLAKGGVSQVGCPFLGGLRSEWMKSGDGGGEGGEGSKKAENGWTSFVHGPQEIFK